MNDADVQDLCSKTIYLVEATSFEILCLWEKHHGEFSWRRDRGCIETVGKVQDRPICVDLMWEFIDGAFVCFYKACSMLIDQKLVEDHLRVIFPSVPRTNAMNFHFVLHALERRQVGGEALT